MINQTLFKLLLLKSLVTNKPILCEWHLYHVPFLITVVLPKGEIEKFLQIMETPESKRISIYSSYNEIDEALTSSHSSPVLITYENGKKADEVIEYIYQKWIAGTINGKHIIGTPILVTEDCTVMDFKKKQFFIFIDEKLEPFPFTIPIKYFVPNQDQFLTIREMIGKYSSDNEKSMLEKTMIAATCFMFPQYNEKAIQFMIKKCSELIKSDEESHDRECLSELFLHTFKDYLISTNFTAVYSIRDTKDQCNLDVANVIDYSIFYDDDYIFLTNFMFSKITEALRKSHIPENSLKQALAEDGILITNAGKKEFTVKKIISIGNEKCRPRVLQLKRSCLYETGEIDPMDFCEENKQRNRKKQCSSQRISESENSKKIKHIIRVIRPENSSGVCGKCSQVRRDHNW